VEGRVRRPDAAALNDRKIFVDWDSWFVTVNRMGFESSLEAAVVAVRPAQACTQNLKISWTQD
jgi:hypothetical protein